MGTFLSYITLSWLHMCFDINLFQAMNTKMMRSCRSVIILFLRLRLVWKCWLFVIELRRGICHRAKFASFWPSSSPNTRPAKIVNAGSFYADESGKEHNLGRHYLFWRRKSNKAQDERKTDRQNEQHPRKRGLWMLSATEWGNMRLLARRRQSRQILFKRAVKKTGVAY